MLPACWSSLGQLMGRNWAILSDFDVIMFFRKDPLRGKEGDARITESKRRREAMGPMTRAEELRDHLDVAGILYMT